MSFLPHKSLSPNICIVGLIGRYAKVASQIIKRVSINVINLLSKRIGFTRHNEDYAMDEKVILCKKPNNSPQGSIGAFNNSASLLASPLRVMNPHAVGILEVMKRSFPFPKKPSGLMTEIKALIQKLDWRERFNFHSGIIADL